jgi:hypothetical protein
MVDFNGDQKWRKQFSNLIATETHGLRSFPSPECYRTFVRQKLSDNEMLGYEPANLEALAQRDWHVRGQTGCQFARLGALQAEPVNWRYLVITGTRHDSNLLATLAERVYFLAREPDCQILSILCPDLENAADAVHAVRNIAQLTEHFWLERDEVIDSFLRLNLRYTLPSGGVTSWVMAFGPMPFLPSTRRSPYFELVLRIKPKPYAIFHRLNQDRHIAHLADIPLKMSEARWEHRWMSTLRRTRMILGTEPDEITAARATLTVPVALVR